MFFFQTWLFALWIIDYMVIRIGSLLDHIFNNVSNKQLVCSSFEKTKSIGKLHTYLSSNSHTILFIFNNIVNCRSLFRNMLVNHETTVTSQLTIDLIGIVYEVLIYQQWGHIWRPFSVTHKCSSRETWVKCQLRAYLLNAVQTDLNKSFKLSYNAH